VKQKVTEAHHPVSLDCYETVDAFRWVKEALPGKLSDGGIERCGSAAAIKRIIAIPENLPLRPVAAINLADGQ
jgi:hypothetical protein